MLVLVVLNEYYSFKEVLVVLTRAKCISSLTVLPFLGRELLT